MNNITPLVLTTLLVVLASIHGGVTAFQVNTPIIRLESTMNHKSSSLNRRVRYSFITTHAKTEYNDFEEDDLSYGGDTDWDAEWKKVVRNENQPSARPKGNDRSDVERAAIRAKREAEIQIAKAKAEAKSAFDFNSLKGDWKFWVAILAVISVATSLLAGAGQTPVGNESYMI